MSDKPIILCVHFGAPGYTPGPGFALVPCDWCKNSMWIGPLQAEKRAEGTAESICLLCMAKHFPPDTASNIKCLTTDSGSRFE